MAAQGVDFLEMAEMFPFVCLRSLLYFSLEGSSLPITGHFSCQGGRRAVLDTASCPLHILFK